MQFSNTSNFAKFLKLVTGLIVSRTNLILQAPGFIQNDTSAVIIATVLAVQIDNTLDPGAPPATNDHYIITNAADINANFGTIAGLEDNDIVRFDGTEFVVSLDVSVDVLAAQRAVTYSRVDEANYIYTTTWVRVPVAAKVVVFYVDWFNESETIQDGDPFWSNGTTPNDESPGGNLTTNTRSELITSLITVPGGTTLDNYNIHYVSSLLFYSDSLTGVDQNRWDEARTTYQGGLVGVNGYISNFVGELVIESGLVLSQRKTLYPNGAGYSSSVNLNSLPSKLMIVCSLRT